MYAVIEDGSRQYWVNEGQLVRVDYRAAEVGSPIEFNRVLLYGSGDGTQVGQPLLEGARVLGEVVEHPSIKLYIQHFRRRKNYRRLRGHRQYYTSVRVRYILLAGQEPPPPPSETPPPESTGTTPPTEGQSGAPEQPSSPPAEQSGATQT